MLMEVTKRWLLKNFNLEHWLVLFNCGADLPRILPEIGVTDWMGIIQDPSWTELLLVTDILTTCKKSSLESSKKLFANGVMVLNRLCLYVTFNDTYIFFIWETRLCWFILDVEYNFDVVMCLHQLLSVEDFQKQHGGIQSSSDAKLKIALARRSGRNLSFQMHGNAFIT